MEPLAIIDLEPWEYEHASNVGIRRFTANWSTRDASHYDRSRMEDDRTAQVAAAACELAVAKYTNQYWHAHIWHRSEHDKYRHMPDVGTNIEVRRVRTSDRAAVRQGGLGKGLVLWVASSVYPELRTVNLWGSIGYDTAWELGQPSHYSETTRLIPIKEVWV
jgi:hypothetical protein